VFFSKVKKYQELSIKFSLNIISTIKIVSFFTHLSHIAPIYRAQPCVL
jgi:hypothetical protein